MTSIYHSTRSTDVTCGAKQAVLEGLAPDGGLFVTDALGATQIDLQRVCNQSFQDNSAYILSVLLDDYTPEEIAQCVHAAYGSTFSSPQVTPVVQPSPDSDYILELYHGPTSAFKDVALQMLPQLMSKSAASCDKRIMILAATSGDTGKAALAGFADTPNLAITVFYPYGGTSEVQRLQMVTQQGDNVAVCAIRGNFDDTQSAVKRIFSDQELQSRLAERGVVLSSANSINVGRLAPQVVYYFDAYSQLVRQGRIQLGDPVEFCVPTGNFGDVLAGYFAKRMGLPVARLIVASNANNVLTDFLTTGAYDRNRPFHKTTSPSMDILISSNLERLLYYVSGADTDYVKSLMTQLSQTGSYTVSPQMLQAIQDTFGCGWATDAQARAAIGEVYAQTGYVMDPHTAVAWHVSTSIPKTPGAARVVLSTASPYKFCGEVCAAVGLDVSGDEFDCMARLEQAWNVAAPQALSGLKDAPVRFTDVHDACDMPAYVEAKCGELL